MDNIIVFRRENNRKVVARRVNLKSTLALGPEGEYFYLKPDDMVYVPRTNLSSMARVMTQVGEMFWFRGWSLGGDLLTKPLINNGLDPNGINNDNNDNLQ